jgi:hypothetical protein
LENRNLTFVEFFGFMEVFPNFEIFGKIEAENLPNKIQQKTLILIFKILNLFLKQILVNIFSCIIFNNLYN